MLEAEPMPRRLKLAGAHAVPCTEQERTVSRGLQGRCVARIIRLRLSSAVSWEAMMKQIKEIALAVLIVCTIYFIVGVIVGILVTGTTLATILG
jgi:hypothetical protein